LDLPQHRSSSTDLTTYPTRRLSNPIAASPSNTAFLVDSYDSLPAIPITEYNNLPQSNSGLGDRSKRGTTKSKKPITRVGHNSSIGEFTGLPKEWQQGYGEVWDKMGTLGTKPEDNSALLQNPVSMYP
jgi:p21-activated kinase 1